MTGIYLAQLDRKDGTVITVGSGACPPPLPRLHLQSPPPLHLLFLAFPVELTPGVPSSPCAARPPSTIIEEDDALWFNSDIHGLSFLFDFQGMRHFEKGQIAKAKVDKLERRLIQVRVLNCSLLKQACRSPWPHPPPLFPLLFGSRWWWPSPAL